MADGRRKKVIIINKKDIQRAADDIRKELHKVGDSGRSSAKGVQEAFENLGKKGSAALNEAFSGNNFKGLKDIEESLKIQRKAVEDLSDQYKKAKAEFDSVNLGTQDEGLIAKRREASKLFMEAKAELESETNLLNKQEEAFKLISTELQTAGDKSVTFYTQMREIREEMQALALAGQDQTPQYDKLRSKLDEVSTAYRKVQQEQQMLAKYGNMVIPGLIQGMSGLSGAMAAYQGVSGLFVKDNKKLAEVQTKLQSAMALTIGLQQVQQTLHSTSAFRIGVVRKATQAWTTAQNALNTSLGISKGLATAFMTGGIMALVAGVGYLITKYKQWSREQDKLRDTVKLYTDAISNEKAQLDYLFDTYKKAEEGTKAYTDAKKKIIDQLDKYYGGLNSEKLLVEDTAEAYNKLSAAIQNSAKEKALQDKYESLAKEAIETQSDAYTNLYDKIITKIGDEKGSKLFARIRKEIEEQGRLSESLISDINSEDSFYRRDLKSDRKTGSSWMEKTDFNEVYELAQTAIKKTTKAQEEYNAEVKKARSILSSLGAESTKIDNSSKSLIDSLRKEREAILKLPEATEQEILTKNRKLQVIDEEIKRLESLGKVEQRGTRDSSTSLIEEIEKKKLEIAKQGVNDRLELLKLEEENELASLERKLQDAEYLEDEKQELILNIKKWYKKERELIQNEEEQKEQERIDKSLEAFKDYQTRKKEIEEHYATLRSNAKGRGGYDVSLINKSEQEEIDKLNKEFYPQAKETAIDLTRASTKQLKEELKSLRDKLKDATDPQIVEALQNRIDKTLNTLENKTPFSIFTSNLKEATQGGKVDFELLGGAISGLIPELQGIADDSRALFGDGTGDFMDGLTEAIGGVADLATSIGAFAEGDIAGGIAGLLSAGNKFFGNAKKVNAEHREALRLLKLQREQLEHQYKVQELLKKLENNRSIFGSDAWGQSRRSAEVYATSIKELEDSIHKLQNVDVVTGSRKSGWGPWKKRKDVWTPILEAYPKLIKSSGEFDRTLAENILSTQKLSDEGKFALQSAIDNADTLEQAYTQMSDNLSAVFGNLGATIMDTFSEAFKSGKDGFADMFDSAGDMLEQFTKQMIYSVTLQPIMEEASKQMMDIQSSSKSDTAKLDMMMEIISSTINDAKNQEDRVNVLLGYAKEQAGKQGLDILNDSKDQKSSTGVSKAASQDSIDVMDGRATHIQETNQEISNNSTAILEQMRTNFTTLNEQMETNRNITLQSMYHLADISKHTHELYRTNELLSRIAKGTARL